MENETYALLEGFPGSEQGVLNGEIPFHYPTFRVIRRRLYAISQGGCRFVWDPSAGPRWRPTTPLK